MSKWMPTNKHDLIAYIKDLVKKIYGTTDPKRIDEIEKERGNLISPLLPPVQDLKDRIDTDPKFNMFFNQMFTEVPPEYTMIINNYSVMLRVINFIITMPPVFTKHHVGCPINAILTWPMGTVNGYAAFLDDDVNKYIKRILTAWRIFLQSKDSALFLNETPEVGWFSERAMGSSNVEFLDETGTLTSQDFFDVFDADKSKEHFGYDSWDAYFTRELKPGARPVTAPTDGKVIVNACESAPYNYKENVKGTDQFWLKTQNYSITFMLANDPLAGQFINGTVYQAFLSNMNYHRYHSPINGRVVKAFVVEGGFYTECRAMGYDEEGDNQSQGYLTETQTRAIIFIQCENDYIGLMAFIGVGMGDVSSCEIFVYEGQKVVKGQQLGTFHIGGSTHCLLFRPGVKVTMDLRNQIPSLNSKIIPVNTLIATVPEDYPAGSGGRKHPKK